MALHLYRPSNHPSCPRVYIFNIFLYEACAAQGPSNHMPMPPHTPHLDQYLAFNAATARPCPEIPSVPRPPRFLTSCPSRSSQHARPLLSNPTPRISTNACFQRCYSSACMFETLPPTPFLILHMFRSVRCASTCTMNMNEHFRTIQSMLLR